jgi:uncharacterized alkaline shock family protein YloU
VTGHQRADTADGQERSTALDLSKRPEPPARIGLNELGRIQVNARAVEKIAALATIEIPDAGGAAARLLGRPVPGAGRLGIRGSGLDSLPKVTADVDGQLGFLDVELSVRWPAPIGQVTEAVRQHLSRRVSELVGLEVREVNINVGDLITQTPPARVS